MGCLLRGGLPLASYRGKDGQSDAEAAQLLNPYYLSTVEQWDDLGLHLFQLKVSLGPSQWMGSGAYKPEELLENAAVGPLASVVCIFQSQCEEV